MITNVNFNHFLDTFKSSDTYKDNFTYEGLEALFDYLEEYEELAGEQIQFDMVALCCDYSEFDDIDDVISQYDQIKDRQDLEDNTQVIDCNNGHIIIQNF